MKNGLLILATLLLVGGALIFFTSCNQNAGAKRYKLAQSFLLTTLKNKEGVKFADSATINVYDTGYKVWRVGSTATAKNMLGMPIEAEWVVEFKPKSTNPSFGNIGDWEMTGYATNGNYNGSMERFEEKAPTAADIKVLSLREKVSEYGSRSIFVTVKNTAKKGAGLITAEADFFDAKNVLLETATGFGNSLAPGDSTVIECMLMGDVEGATNYSAKIKSVLFDR